MALDFPTSPSVNQLYPDPVQPGIPQYRWNGTVWVTESETGTSYVEVAGDTMTGALTLPGNPTAVLHAATKQYVDASDTVRNVRRNRITNGAMQVSQEFGNTAIATSGLYPADQWTFYNSSVGGTTAARAGPAFGTSVLYYIGITSSPPLASAAAAAYAQFATSLEGGNVADFNLGSGSSKQFILAFTVNISVVGQYWVVFVNPSNTHRYLASFSIATGELGLWVRKQVVVPAGGINAGSWYSGDATPALIIGFTPHCGANYVGVAGMQSGTSKYVGPGAALGLSTASGWFVTDVGLYLDADNTGVAPNWETPDYALELARCQRYWQRYISLMITSGWVSAGGLFFGSFTIPSMRTSPGMTLSNPNYSNSSAVAVNGSPTPNNFKVMATATAAAGAYVIFDATLSARM